MRKVFGTILALLWLFVLCTGAWADNKTPFFAKRQAGGGIVIADQTQTTGNYWFVDSGSANASDAAGYGQNPDAPVATIDYAIGLATANNGDVIVVMPGHAEDISTASQIDIDVAGIRILGIGEGRSRPVLTWTAAAGYIEVNAANSSMENMVLDLSTAGLAVTGVSFYTSGTDFRFKDMEVILYEFGSGSATRALYLESGGTRTQIDNCKFFGDDNASSGVSEVIGIPTGGANGIYIVNSYISAYSSSPLINGNASAVSDFYIANTVLNQNKATGQNLDMTSAQGIMKDVVSGFPSGVTLTTSGLVSANIF